MSDNFATGQPELFNILLEKKHLAVEKFPIIVIYRRHCKVFQLQFLHQFTSVSVFAVVPGD